MKRFVSFIVVLAMAVSLVPAFEIQASAASIAYYETTKNGVPLRNAIGSEKTIVARVAKKGTVVWALETKKNWTSPITATTWLKVRVLPGTTEDGPGGEFWLYEGNVTKHSHVLSAGSCTSVGCGYEKTLTIVDSKARSMEVKQKTAVVRDDPYNDGKIVATLSKGDPVSVTNKVKNYKGSYWFKLASGDFIYSENVKEATAKKVAVETNNSNNSGGASGGTAGSGGGTAGSGGGSGGGSSSGSNNSFFVPPYSQGELLQICTHTSWSVGECVLCGKKWELKEVPVKGTFAAQKDGVVVRTIPYKQGAEVKRLAKDEVIDVVAKAVNSAKHTWYKTADGNWVYEVGQVKLSRAYFAKSGHTFHSMTETVIPTVLCEPFNATIEKEWTVAAGEDIITLDSQTGKITPKAPGKATVSCVVKPDVGVPEILNFEVTVDEAAALPEWTYDNQKYEKELALQCAEYATLSYPGNDCKTYSKEPIKITSKNESTEPKGLTELLKKREFGYMVSNTYYKPLETTSPYVLASKKVRYNGAVKDLIFVILEGSAGLAGWQGNMKMSSNGAYYEERNDHYTFNLAAENVKAGLEAYIKKNALSKPLVVITGHSRGAASGNLLAAKITNDTNYEKVYAYLFATPNTTKRPNYNLKNIFNICNELDFVAYIPFSNNGWGFEKHGVIVSFNSEEAYRSNKKFAATVKEEYGTPDYVWNAADPQEIRGYTSGIWQKTEEYYEHRLFAYPLTSCQEEAFEYFYDGLAKAASGPAMTTAAGAQHMLGHILHVCPFGPLTLMFGVNATFGKMTAFKACHTAETYHAAVYADIPMVFMSPDASMYSEMGESNPALLNGDEYDAMYSFFCQGENKLMLELAGWNAEDSSTWKGVKWNADGNIVSIDLSYLNLSGWFNANNYPKLQTLNVDGNSLTMLAVSECAELVNLSCMVNNLSSLAVDGCDSLQNLDCSFNQISSLNLSGQEQLAELNCFGNQISDLDLSGATALQTVRCGNNELSSVDISTNINLSRFYCSNNRIVETENQALLSRIEAINNNGGSAEIGPQKYNEEYSFDAAELASLTDFAGMALNLEKLGWNLEEPYTWQGVEWKIIGNEYHITAINFDGLDLEGTLNLPEAEYIESVSCEDSSLRSLNLAGCTSLNTLNCRNAGLSSLEIADCSALTSIDCNENYLAIEDVESSLNQIGLSTGLATYETQNIAVDEEFFNQTEREILISFLSTGNNADVLGWDWDWPGTWEGIVWTNADGEYRVNKIDFSEKDVCGTLDLTAFGYLETFSFSGTQISEVVLPNCITKIPQYAFYNSGIERVYMSEGVTNVETAAFAHCDSLTTVVLPATVTRVLDNAFYGSENLKNLVFIGDEPVEIGAEIAQNTSPEFKIIFFEGTAWNTEEGLLCEYSYLESKDAFVVLLDGTSVLPDNGYYSETNNYAGDDIAVTVVSQNPETSVCCALSVYNELGGFSSLSIMSVELEKCMNVVTFEDVDVQYVGEEFCTLKAFLLSDADSMKPLAAASETVLIKQVAE